MTAVVPRAAPGNALARVLLALGVLAGLLVLADQFASVAGVFPWALAAALVLQVPVAMLGFWLFRRLRPVRSPPRGAALTALAWGATAACGCAILANGGLSDLWAKLAGVAFTSRWGATLTAPPNEELLKVAGVALLALAAPQVVRGPIDGLVLGALTGLGFQVTENAIYGLNLVLHTGGIDPVTGVVESFVVRVGITALGSHWTMTAVAGTGIGLLAARGHRAIVPALAFLLAGMAMHGLFDAPLLPFPDGTLVKVGVNFLAVTLLYLLVRRTYRARIRLYLASQAAQGLMPPEEAASLFTRKSRLRARWHMARGPDRSWLARHQHRVLDQAETWAAHPGPARWVTAR